MTPAIWQDIGTRLRNLRADMLTQWQGDIDNREIENAVTALGNVLQMWKQARPVAQNVPQSMVSDAPAAPESGTIDVASVRE